MMTGVINNRRGFTLVEMIIVTAIFVVVIMITASAFETILKYTTRLSRSEESNIEGVIGLEILRHDLMSAGFGLPSSFDPNNVAPSYSEEIATPGNAYNDGNGTSSAGNVPRPIVTGNILLSTPSSDDAGVAYNIINNTDYLAIKATSVSRVAATQKWSFVNYSSVGLPPKNWPSPSDNITGGSWVTMLKRTFTANGYTNQLVVDPASATNDPLYFSPTYPTSSTGVFAGAFEPPGPTDTHYIYGVEKAGGSNYPHFPFNRVDYFVARPPAASVPAVCSTAKDSGGKYLVGTLYKASVYNGGTASGKLHYMPVLDCVADFQVILGWDTNNDGVVDTWSNADGSAKNGPASITDIQKLLATADGVNSGLKVIKIFVLAQIGKYDPSYTAPNSIDIGDPTLGETSLTRPLGYPITSDMQHYRWKLYKIIARPKNLISNQ